MGLVLVAPLPAEEPVSLEEARSHFRVDSTEEDPLIALFIKSARQHVEQTTGRALITQHWRYTVDRPPSYWEPIRLGRSPLISVETFTYVDQSGAPTVWASSNYIVDTSAVNGELTLAYGKSWPPSRYIRNALTIDFTAGYGSSPDDVPFDLRAAILLIANDLFMNREAQVTGTIIQENETVERLLSPYRTTLVA